MTRPWFWRRPGEWWIGQCGLFFRRLYGIEFPNGTFVGFSTDG